MGFTCEFGIDGSDGSILCGKPAPCTVVWPDGSVTVQHMCAEHYDRIAASYKDTNREHDLPPKAWGRRVVRLNGWE